MKYLERLDRRQYLISKDMDKDFKNRWLVIYGDDDESIATEPELEDRLWPWQFWIRDQQYTMSI